jgi:hypothetical protein
MIVVAFSVAILFNVCKYLNWIAHDDEDIISEAALRLFAARCSPSAAMI